MSLELSGTDFDFRAGKEDLSVGVDHHGVRWNSGYGPWILVTRMGKGLTSY